MKYESSLQAIEETGSAKAYYDQFPTVQPEINKVYSYKPSVIEEKVKIIAIVEDVAIGETISDNYGGCYVGRKHMFHITGLKRGWVYGENRPSYRLKELSQ